MKGRLGSALLGVLLLAVGFLLGSAWLEWRHARMPEASTGAGTAGPAVSLPEGFESRVRVEVLNGMGEPEAARRAAGRLRGMGFDVVYFGNADGFGYERTRVVARAPEGEGARTVAESLGIDSVAHRPDTALYLDATVVLGADWPRLTAALDSISPDRTDDGSDLLTPLRRLLEGTRD